MNRRQFIGAGLAAACSNIDALDACAEGAVSADTTSSRRPASCDTFVYGSTPGGIATAVEAARRGNRVVLACPKNNPGGMTASGLCTTDALRKHLFGGFVIELIERIRQRYRRIIGGDEAQWKLIHDGWHYEPSVAEDVFRDILATQEDRLRWLPGHWLDAVEVENGRIRSVDLETPDGATVVISAGTYVDCSYEGDLAAKAGVPCRVGREGRDEYGESLAGIHYMNWRTGEQIITADTGETSVAIQAFCMRSIFTDDPDHLVPVEKPATYEQHLQDYLPLLDDFRSGRVRGWWLGSLLPKRKYQMNGKVNALTSLNCPGVNWGYPEAGRRHRQKLDEFHRDHAAGLIYFLQHDKHVPENISAKLKRIGLHDEEFGDNGHWPWQLYVRQGRRIEGRATITQHNFVVDPKTGRTPPVEHPIALGEYSFDVHPCHDRRFAVDGFMEGMIWTPESRKTQGAAQPGQIPFEAMLPKRIDNLLVPVAMSSTHIAMSVLRMEPVWMTAGQVAGLAASIAREKNCDVAQLDPMPFPDMLNIRIEP
ncbi:MAG: FAD-dependent oxidoreductase [Pirellulales bacterium]|nr:FAD-dependent oxidoreductase [Pirellulales bacterium]